MVRRTVARAKSCLLRRFMNINVLLLSTQSKASEKERVARQCELPCYGSFNSPLGRSGNRFLFLRGNRLCVIGATAHFEVSAVYDR
jgi:hypothetical protein